MNLAYSLPSIHLFKRLRSTKLLRIAVPSLPSCTSIHWSGNLFFSGSVADGGGDLREQVSIYRAIKEFSLPKPMGWLKGKNFLWYNINLISGV